MTILTGERFFVRRISLASESEITSQVELALETVSPFSLEQLFHGFVVDQTRRHALIYAAYRRGFSASEQVTWNDAQSVLPAFLLWTTTRPAGGAALLVRETNTQLEAIVWDEVSELPSLVITRAITNESADSTRAQLLAEITTRTGLAANRAINISGGITVTDERNDGLKFSSDHAFAGVLSPAALAAADVRDKRVLAAQQHHRRRSAIMWGVFAATLSALAACLLLEGALFGARTLLASQRREIVARAPAIQQIESAQYLATKLEKMAAQQLRPFEMLAVINAPRPASVDFQRVGTNGALKLEVEAQTANAADPRLYENALKQLPAIERVEFRDLRMRSGITTFSFDVTFKPNWATTGGAR